MNDETWLRDALRAAAGTGRPAGGPRAAGALARASRRRRQRLTAVSCTAAVAVVVATAVAGGGSGTTGLRPVTPTTESPTPSPVEPTLTPTPSPSPSPTATPEPTAARPTSSTAQPTATPTPVASTWYAPPPPDPLDVYFVVDATGDMQPSLDDVRTAVEQITAELTAAIGRDVAVGYATVRDFDTIYPQRRVYERLAAIRVRPGPLPEYEIGGGEDVPEAHTVALLGATGRRESTFFTAQPAGFRMGARKVVVLLTNAPMKQGDQYPSIAETIQGLRAEDVSFAALRFAPDQLTEADGAVFGRVARETGGVARKAVDCDGSGSRGERLRPGDPLVCGVGEDGVDVRGFAAALVALAMPRA